MSDVTVPHASLEAATTDPRITAPNAVSTHFRLTISVASFYGCKRQKGRVRTAHGRRSEKRAPTLFADALQLTIVGTTVGTVAYMSPEQARGEEADVRSDVWALGVVLYEMLTGQPPFKGAYPEAISYAIRNDPPPPLSGSGREIPEAVERLVLRALEKDPAQRFQTAREMARDLRLLQGRSVPLRPKL